MNDNVGDMPLDIFGDYISDILGEEWTWEYLVIADNGSGHRNEESGDSYGMGINQRHNITAEEGIGRGIFWNTVGCSYPTTMFFGYGHNHEYTPS